MMRHRARTMLHAALLAALAAGVVYGTVMLTGYLVMLTAALLGRVPVAELTPFQLTFGILMVLLWGGAIVAGHRALLLQYRRGRELAQWVTGSTVPPSSRLTTAATHAAAHRGELRPGRGGHAGRTDRGAAPRGLPRPQPGPLKVLALRTWTAAFFFLPVVGSLFGRILDR